MDRMVVVGLIVDDTNEVARYLDRMDNLISIVEKKDKDFTWGSYIKVMTNLGESEFYNSLVVHALRVLNLHSFCIEDIEIEPQKVKNLSDVINTYDASIKSESSIFNSFENKVYSVIHKGNVVKAIKNRLGLDRFRVTLRGEMNGCFFEDKCIVDIENKTLCLYAGNRLVYGNEIECPLDTNTSVIELSNGDLNGNLDTIGDYCVKSFDTFYMNTEIRECIVPNGVKSVVINVTEKVDCLIVIPPTVESILTSSFISYLLDDRHLNFKIKLLFSSRVDSSIIREILANLYNFIKLRYAADSSMTLDALIKLIENNTKFSIEFY